ncbi:hypothetical protein PMZ80_005918 [Knufia obscura]|uniref:tRNA(Phe) 7-[(3-amino-3-carboxypropyl)-4-demethylwyosine(37)-N(4)]-methyltransferase n=2 Tax=Knufia TaxID=430999 RepID=A0AAN8EFT8_9EURO|nr:hypothetical protein PMZ80_005918 [Knufia obscura]KAK5954588.1 hypothetical protein OHC33_004310 [Knufia fluminis]
MPPPHQKHNHIPPSFTKKKSQTLSEISNHDTTDYNDKSPKGTIDSEIIDLIDEINAFEGYVTTSSCAGRVAVFVEGRKAVASSATVDGGAGVASSSNNEDGEVAGDSAESAIDGRQTSRGAGPGGKGHGNRWLYVSHEPIPSSHLRSANPMEFHELFQLAPQPQCLPSTANNPPRLIKLSFAPLILHILCANLHAAKGLLAAAINAGFRESGVQSLRALDDEDSGVMVGIRTAGVGFETVVGVVEEVGWEEVYRSLVGEGYLRMCVGVVNERFGWNVERRERLRGELAGLRGLEGKERLWEEKGARRERMRVEGLRRRKEQEQAQEVRVGGKNGDVDEEDVLDGGVVA